MLAMISANATGTSMCMKFTEFGMPENVCLIIAPARKVRGSIIGIPRIGRAQ